MSNNIFSSNDSNTISENFSEKKSIGRPSTITKFMWDSLSALGLIDKTVSHRTQVNTCFMWESFSLLREYHEKNPDQKWVKYYYDFGNNQDDKIKHMVILTIVGRMKKDFCNQCRLNILFGIAENKYYNTNENIKLIAMVKTENECNHLIEE